MNAYELAKGLDQFSDLGGDFFGKCANMLRQQADRIAELSKNVDELEEELLKTPQIKELSDEEIQSIWNEGIVGWYATQEESVLKFARAILKKASEK